MPKSQGKGQSLLCHAQNHIVTVAYPKLDPSNPLATSENCCAASLVRFTDRELGVPDDHGLSEISQMKEDQENEVPKYSLDKLLFRVRSRS